MEFRGSKLRKIKGPRDPIGGTSKRKADLAVKNDKAIIQDAHDFYHWVKETEETSWIKFSSPQFKKCYFSQLLF